MVLGKSETEGAELAGMMVGKSDKTVQEWHSHFLANSPREQARTVHTIRCTLDK